MKAHTVLSCPKVWDKPRHGWHPQQNPVAAGDPSPRWWISGWQNGNPKVLSPGPECVMGGPPEYLCVWGQGSPWSAEP